MRKYYVVIGELSFGFGGFIRKAYTTQNEAEKVVESIKKKYNNITDIRIEEVEAKNKKEAENLNKKSMYTGSFKGIDSVRI